MSKSPEDATVRLARALVRVPSVTAAGGGDEASQRVLRLAADAAEKAGGAVTRLDFEGGHPKWGYPVSNLFIDWSFGKPEKHVCYIGHLDVVPPGNRQAWRDSPYSGKISGGHLYGRGATDMKGSVAAFLTAIESALDALKESGNIRVSIILTTDEEWAAVNGTTRVLQWMKAQGMAPDAFIVGEPSSPSALGSHIKIGRRGSLVGTFNVRGMQGHAAYKDLFENPNRALALAMAILNSHTWKDGDAEFPATSFEPVALRSGDFNASAIIPGTAEALWNIRYTPRQTPEKLEQWIRDTLSHPPAWARRHPDAPLLRRITVTANKDTAARPYRSKPGELTAAARAAIHNVLGKMAKLDGSGGTSDGRFAAETFPLAEVIELGLPEQGGMHQIDERVSIADLIQLREIFKQTVINYDRQKFRRRHPSRPRP